ncbi:MAG: SPASM domain-containing protein, partial [Acidobacteriota bacterium]
RHRGARAIVEEMRRHVERWGINQFSCNDLLLNGNLIFLGNLCDASAEAGLDISWWGNAVVHRLMDRDLFEKIRYIHAAIPGCKVVVTSNGHFLTPPVVDAILALGSGLHELYVSFQGLDREAYERTMRGSMNFDRTLANVNHFIDEQRRRGLDRPKLWITMVDTAVIDARKAVAYWRARGVASKFTTLENRGGNIRNAESFSRTKAMSYYTTCTRLFKQAYILFNGDMVLCCVDYSREQVLGNIMNSSIHDVWNGPVAQEIRRRYLAHEFDGLPLCGNCKIDEVREVATEADGTETIGAAEVVEEAQG